MGVANGASELGGSDPAVRDASIGRARQVLVSGVVTACCSTVGKVVAGAPAYRATTPNNSLLTMAGSAEPLRGSHLALVAGGQYGSKSLS